MIPAKKKLAVFASGGGSNTLNILGYFRNKNIAEITVLISNKKSAGILSNSQVSHVPKKVISRSEFYETDSVTKYLIQNHIDLIILAGFLWKIPDSLIKAFPNKIINIHPALLPKFGGKGMYGMHVHRAVFESGDVKSGMTIHYINERYDEGEMIFQATCDIADAGSPEEVASRVLRLEHKYYPQIIEQVLFQN